MTENTSTRPQPLVMERTLNAPIAKVWQALTDPEALKQWSPFIPDFKPEVGFEFEFSLGPNKDHQYRHLCEVTEVVAGQKLTYSWRYEGYEGNSFITYELSAEGDQTKLKLTWAGLETFPDTAEFARENFASGATYNLSALQTFIEQQR